MAKLVACRACDNQVSRDARACPKCGAPRRRHRVGLILLCVVGGFVAIAAAAGKGKDRHAGPAAPAADLEPPIGVSAEQLRKDYKANEVSADERYRGHALLVTGAVRAVKKDILDDPYVELSTSNDFESVPAHFAETGALGKLSRGDRITVRCIGNNVVIGSPQLKDCVLQ